MAVYTKYGYLQKREHKNPKLCSMFPVPHPETYKIVRRVFELGMEGMSASKLSKTVSTEFPIHRASLNKSMIDKRLRDSFYCGLWVVRKGTKQERRIDLNKIQLPDGTKFSPVLSEAQFNELQAIRIANRSGISIKRKRLNPLPRLITCQRCGGAMYPSYRKITVA